MEEILGDENTLKVSGCVTNVLTNWRDSFHH